MAEGTEEFNDIEETFDEIKRSWFTYELIGYFCVYLFLVFGLEKLPGLASKRKSAAQTLSRWGIGNTVFMWQIFYILLLCFVCRCVAYAADIFNFEQRIALLTETWLGNIIGLKAGSEVVKRGAAYTLSTQLLGAKLGDDGDNEPTSPDKMAEGYKKVGLRGDPRTAKAFFAALIDYSIGQDDVETVDPEELMAAIKGRNLLTEVLKMTVMEKLNSLLEVRAVPRRLPAPSLACTPCPAEVLHLHVMMD